MLVRALPNCLSLSIGPKHHGGCCVELPCIRPGRQLRAALLRGCGSVCCLLRMLCRQQQSYAQLPRCSSVRKAPSVACRDARSRAVVVKSSSRSSTVDSSLQQQLQAWSAKLRSNQQKASQFAAASGTAVALAAIAPSTYDLLSTATLPPVSLLLEVLTGSLAAAVTIVKAVHGDNVHLDLHKGQVYLQLGVPSSGPPLQPGSVITRPTGDVRGNGAYAVHAIPAGTHIADYEGELLDNDAFLSRYPDGVGDFVMAIDREYVIDAAARVAATDSFHPVHMNHSRSRHNVLRYYQRSKGRVAFFASRDIQPGEELLYDYGRAYWRGREHMELP